MFFPCESFLAPVAVIHSFQLFTPVGAFYVLRGAVVDNLLTIGIFCVQLRWRSFCANIGLVSLNIGSFMLEIYMYEKLRGRSMLPV